MISKINSFVRLNKETRKLFTKAYVLCGYYRFRMLFTPFNSLAKKIGRLGVESSDHFCESEMAYIKRVRKVVILAGRYTPWESLCLVQALAVQHLLDKRALDNTVYLGLGKGEDNKPIAHAWIKHGGKVIVGEKGIEKFSVVAMFGSIH